MHCKRIDFSLYSSIRIGGACDVVVIDCVEHYPELQIVGHAYNLLISPAAKNLAVLGKAFEGISDEGAFLKVGAATPSGRLFSYAKKQNLAGFEMLGGLPGSVGGLVKMNAGMREYEIGAVLEGIFTADGFIPAEALALGYRSSQINSIIFYALFRKIPHFRTELLEVFAALRAKQPKEPSAGSAFKNPSGDYAGRLIEAVGLKGYQKGGAMFSPKHANFLLNTGGALFDEAFWLLSEAKRRVSEEFGILLEQEIVIL